MNAARRTCARAVLAALLVVFAAPLAAQVDALWTAPLERLHASCVRVGFPFPCP